MNAILPDTPAFKSDLHVTDVITEVDGVSVGSDRELQKQIRLKKIGANVQLTVFRRGRTMKLTVATSELPTEVVRTAHNNPVEPAARGEGEPPKPDGTALYGMQTQTLTKDASARMGLTTPNGIVIVAVDDDSPAARAGIRVRDVITAVDDEPVKDVTAFREAMKKGDPARGIACFVERPEGKTFAVIKTN